jgi:hypothetical protein
MYRTSEFERKCPRLIPIGIICVFLAAIATSCGDQSSEFGPAKTSEPASASFSIIWRTDSSDRTSENSAVTKQAISDDCAGVGVANVECLVYDGTSMRLLTSARWACSAGQGYMDDIPPGENRKFVVLGLNDIELIVYRGEAANGVDFNPGQFVEVEEPITVSPFAAGLPGTGQSETYAEIYGEDSNYPPDCPHLFTKLDDYGKVLDDSASSWAMVRDEVTGLIWEVKTNDGGIHDVDALFTWQAAQDDFIVQINNDNFGGYNDWRLPTTKELFAIAHKGSKNPGDSAVDPAKINSSSESMYWAATDYFNGPLSAWRMRAVNGDIYNSSKSGSHNAIAVRGAINPISLVDNGNGTVTDEATGLMWQKGEAAAGAMTWNESLAYCEDLSLAGHDDWRLPNINELQSIVDYNAFEPSIDTTFFPEAVAEIYWSSTTFVEVVSEAWNISFLNGDVYAWPFNKDEKAYVRAVRSANPASSQ